MIRAQKAWVRTTRKFLQSGTADPDSWDNVRAATALRFSSSRCRVWGLGMRGAGLRVCKRLENFKLKPEKNSTSHWTCLSTMLYIEQLQTSKTQT